MFQIIILTILTEDYKWRFGNLRFHPRQKSKMIQRTIRVGPGVGGKKFGNISLKIWPTLKSWSIKAQKQFFGGGVGR